MSQELDLCFVGATDLINEAVRHILDGDTCGEHLREELLLWQHGVSEKREKKQETAEYCLEGPTIPFHLVARIHEQLKVSPLDCGDIYLHELMKGSSLCLPVVKLPPRNPELVARLDRVQAMADNKAYKRMVKNVDLSSHDAEFHSLGLEVQATSRQIWAMVNFLVTVVGGFMFGYFVAYYAGFSIPLCVSLGLIFGTVVFMADLYFIVRTDLVPPSRSNKPTKRKQKKD